MDSYFRVVRRKILTAAALLLCSASLILAQSNTADIVGTVTDTTGAVVPNATVTAVNLGTGQTRSAPSNAVGEYAFSLLQVGNYSVKVEAAGFKQFRVPSVTLSAGDRVRVDAQLQTGGTSETVTVTSVAPALQTDSSTVGGLVENAQVQDLPLNGRNFINLVTLQPGVTAGLGGAFGAGTKPDDHRETSSYSANGQTDQANNNLIDGFDNNDRLIGVIGVRPSPDAIEEVKVETGLYTAEVGRSAGGVVDIITKSGTNKVHGSVYEYFRNNIFDAENYFGLPGKKNELRQNQYGGSIGGPLRKDKTFFFADYEGFRQVSGETITSTVPTAYDQTNCSMANGCDFSDQRVIDNNPFWPAADYKVPANQMNAIGLAYFRMFPSPNNPASPYFNNFVYTPNLTQNTDLFDVRGDHHFSDRTTLYGRYSFNNVTTFLPGAFPLVTVGSGSSAVSGVQPGSGTFGAANAEFSGNSAERQMQMGLTLTHIFKSNLMGEAKFGFMRNHINSLASNAGLSPATAMGYTGVNVAQYPQTAGLPSFILGNGFSGIGDTAFQPELELDNSFQYLADVVYSPVNHIIKVGVGLIQRQATNDQSIFPRGAGFMVGAASKIILGLGNYEYIHPGPLQDLVMGQAESIFRQTGLVASEFRTWEPSIYAQDDWRITHAITLNLGVRYDIFTPYTSPNNQISNFDFANNLIVGPALPGANNSNATAGVKTDYADIAPRIGFAVDLGHGMVVRGGFGMSYFPGNFTLQSFLKNPPYAASFECGFVNPPTALPCIGTGFGGGVSFGPGANGVNYQLGAEPAPPSTPDLTQATNQANYAGKLFYAMDFNFKPTYIEQYSLQLQKDFHGNVVSIGYVGNEGRHLVGYPNLNQPAYAGATTPIYVPVTNFGVTSNLFGSTIISTGVSAGVSSYNALQVTLERRLAKGLSGNANYTWAHALANISSNGESPSNIPNPDRFSCVGLCRVNIPGSSNYTTVKSWEKYDYGNSELDVRQRLAFTLGYELPVGKNLTGAAAILAKGWTVNALYYYQTGLPFTVENTQNAADPGGTYDGFTNSPSRPNLVSTAKASKWTVSQYFNSTAFATQATGTLGNERKNQITAPNDTALNLSLIKAFVIKEDLKLQFRAEAFNLSNTPTFNPPDNGFGDPQFGIISSTVPGAPPRQIQFALKLLF
jgi:hypothetical protein